MLERIAEHPVNRVDELLPWNVAAQLVEIEPPVLAQNDIRIEFEHDAAPAVATTASASARSGLPETLRPDGGIAFAALVWTLVRGVYDGVSLLGVLAAVAMIVVGIVGSTRSCVRP